MVDALSKKLTMLIKTKVKEITEEKAEIINYGLQCMFSFISKLFIILTLSYLLGILKLVIISMFSMGIYRAYAGGVHADTHLKCLFSSIVMSICPVYISMYISYCFGKSSLVYLGIFITNSIVIYLYAPADVKQKPVLNKKFREKMRLGSLVSMSAIIILALLIQNNPLISNLIVISTLIESLTMLPITYKMFGCERGYAENET